MSSNLPYSLDDLQTRINALINNDNDTPTAASDEDEYEHRINLINQAIGEYESQDVLWDELWTTYTHGSVLSGTATYVLSSLTDMRFPGGFVKLTLDGSDNWVEVISPEQAQNHTNSRAVYFTGNPSVGVTLNLCWTPTSGDGTFGATITFPYYKYATRFTTDSLSTDKPEMSDPNFIVYNVAAMKSMLESQNDKFGVFNTMALNCLDRMKVMNEIKPHYQNNTLDDVDALYGAVMGE